MTLGTFSERLGTFEQSAERPRCKSVVDSWRRNWRQLAELAPVEITL